MTAPAPSTAIDPPVPARPPRPGHAWLSRLLLAVPVVLTAAVVLALAGAARDDAHIDARTGNATAQVVAVGPMRTAVQFAGPDGEVYSPDEGLAYPSGLQVGQLVRVEYDLADPDEVRVAGRTWVIGLLPAAVTLLVLWGVLVPAGWVVLRRLRSPARAAAPARGG